MNSLFPDDQFRPKKAKELWPRNLIDSLLDRWCMSDAIPVRLGYEFHRSKKAVERLIQKFLYNTNGRAEKYQLLQRISRIGMRFTQNELLMIIKHRELGISPEVTAGVLARDPDEIISMKV